MAAKSGVSKRGVAKRKHVVGKVLNVPGDHVGAEQRHVNVLGVDDHVAKCVVRRGVERGKGGREVVLGVRLHVGGAAGVGRLVLQGCSHGCGRASGKRGVQVQQ